MAEILVVDDQSYVSDLLADELTEEGHSITTISDTQRIWDHLDDSPVDIVLLDLFLDGPQGWKVLDRIKTQNPHLPVVIFTAYDTYREDPRLSKAAAYVVKSFDLNELKGTIRCILDNGGVSHS
jgi:two-component system response regulator (stage 0 sporulation protein F)